MTGWHETRNTQKYDQYAKTFPTYEQTSRDLVDFADVKPEMAVVDLACGTGVTSQAILRALNNTGDLHSVDMSQVMLDTARQNLTGHDVSFHISSAENLAEVIDHLVDRVVCNAAFWQMRADETLKAIGAILKPGGIFAYNLPRPFFASEDAAPGSGQGGSLDELMRQAAISNFGVQASSLLPSTNRSAPLTLDDIQALLQRHGFMLISHKVVTYTQSVEGALEFYRIPVMTERILPGVSYEIRMAILEHLQTQLNPAIQFNMSWLFISARSTA